MNNFSILNTNDISSLCVINMIIQLIRWCRPAVIFGSHSMVEGYDLIDCINIKTKNVSMRKKLANHTKYRRMVVSDKLGHCLSQH